MQKINIVWLSLLLACGEEAEKEAPDLVDSNTQDDSCGGTAPVITSLECVNPGMQEHPDYGLLPTFSIRAVVHDDDGDLTYYQMFVDIDGTLDGVEDENSIPLNPAEGALSDEACGITDANLGITMYLNGSSPDYDTRYEWYVQVSDSLGKTSEAMMIECSTPNEEGIGDP